jgi:uncharacterized cupin superfamily protein
MTDPVRPDAVIAADVPARSKPSNYPEPFASRMRGREKRAVGDLFGLQNFGVNLTRLPPGSVTALHHRHSEQDEMIFVLEGRPTLYVDDRLTQLEPGMCAGFTHDGAAHHLENRTAHDVVILEIGDRAAGDEVTYPDDDLQAVRKNDTWHFMRRDGTPY